MRSSAPSCDELLSEIAELRERLSEAEEALEAISNGEVDAVVVSGQSGCNIYTLTGSDHPYRVLVEAMNEGAATLSGSGCVLYCNSALAHMLRLPLEHMIGTNLLDHVRESDRQGVTLMVEKSIADGNCKGEMAFMAGGESFPAHISCRAVEIEGMRCIAAVITDLREQKHAMEELREKERLLVQQSRQAAMGEMIGNIAHQWRQPLNSLGLYIQELPIVYEVGGFTKEYLDETVEKSMQLVFHMSQTIDDFRNFFKPNKEKTSFPLKESVYRTISLIEKSFSDRRIEIRCNVGDEIHIEGYFNEFSQVLLNIMNNAKDAFVDRSIEEPILHVEGLLQGKKAVITLTDNGGGVPEKILDNLFDPYFTTKGPVGTGVGLFMSKVIVENSMNGKLSVRNTGNGAEFRIEVPQAPFSTVVF